MAKFVSAQFRKGPRGGDRILSTARLREMHRVRHREQLDARQRGRLRRHARKDKVYVGHGGSYPGYITQTMIQLDDKVGVIVLTNAQDSTPAASRRS
jgi:D-alanyl-D-alanine carboxypeptidase